MSNSFDRNIELSMELNYSLEEENAVLADYITKYNSCSNRNFNLRIAPSFTEHGDFEIQHLIPVVNTCTENYDDELSKKMDEMQQFWEKAEQVQERRRKLLSLKRSIFRKTAAAHKLHRNIKASAAVLQTFLPQVETEYSELLNWQPSSSSSNRFSRTNRDTNATSTSTTATNTDSNASSTNTNAANTDVNATSINTNTTNTDVNATSTNTNTANTDVNATNTDVNATNTDNSSYEIPNYASTLPSAPPSPTPATSSEYVLDLTTDDENEPTTETETAAITTLPQTTTTTTSSAVASTTATTTAAITTTPDFSTMDTEVIPLGILTPTITTPSLAATATPTPTPTPTPVPTPTSTPAPTAQQSTNTIQRSSPETFNLNDPVGLYVKGVTTLHRDPLVLVAHSTYYCPICWEFSVGINHVFGIRCIHNVCKRCAYYMTDSMCPVCRASMVITVSLHKPTDTANYVFQIDYTVGQHVRIDSSSRHPVTHTIPSDLQHEIRERYHARNGAGFNAAMINEVINVPASQQIIRSTTFSSYVPSNSPTPAIVQTIRLQDYQSTTTTNHQSTDNTTTTTTTTTTTSGQHEEFDAAARAAAEEENHQYWLSIASPRPRRNRVNH